MDFLLSKYGLIFTEFDSIDRGGAEVNTFKFSKYQTIFTELNVHNCFIIYWDDLWALNVFQSMVSSSEY